MSGGTIVRYRQNPRTAGRVIDGLAFIITPDDHKLHTLNGTGTRIWELCAAGATLGQVAGALTGGFEVEEPRATADAERFLADLVARGILAQDPEA